MQENNSNSTPILETTSPTPKTPMEMVKIGINEIIAKVTGRNKLVKPTLSETSVQDPATIVNNSQLAQSQAIISSSTSAGTDATASMVVNTGVKDRFPIKKLIFFAVGFLILIIMLLILAVIFKLPLPGANPVVINPQSSPTAAPVVFTPPPTKYATDQDILKLNQDINSLEDELSKVDVEESNLKPRLYKWNINFK